MIPNEQCGYANRTRVIEFSLAIATPPGPIGQGYRGVGSSTVARLIIISQSKFHLGKILYFLPTYTGQLPGLAHCVAPVNRFPLPDVPTMRRAVFIAGCFRREWLAAQLTVQTVRNVRRIWHLAALTENRQFFRLRSSLRYAPTETPVPVGSEKAVRNTRSVFGVPQVQEFPMWVTTQNGLDCNPLR
jgi:hypothetical protein